MFLVSISNIISIALIYLTIDHHHSSLSRPRFRLALNDSEYNKGLVQASQDYIFRNKMLDYSRHFYCL